MLMRRLLGGGFLAVLGGALVLLPLATRVAAAGEAEPPSTIVEDVGTLEDLVPPPLTDTCGGVTSDAPQAQEFTGRSGSISGKLIPDSGSDLSRASIDVSSKVAPGARVEISKRQHEGTLQLVGTLWEGVKTSVVFEHTALCGPTDIAVKVNSDGTAYIIRPTSNGVPEMIGVAAPWAIDANGEGVPTWYESRGSALIQVIDAGDRLGPITFDPTYSTINCEAYASNDDARAYLNIAPGDQRICAPTGMFFATNGYTPVFGFETNVDNDYGRVALRQDGGCSYSPDTGWAWDFQVPCKAHDYCYDLRKAGFSGTVSDSACDSAFYDIMEAHCNNRVFSGDCRIARDIAYVAVSAPPVVTNANPGVVFAVNMQSGKCMDIEGPSTGTGASIQQWTCADVSQQKWRIWPQPGYPGLFKIVSEHSDKCVAASPIYNIVVQQSCTTESFKRIRIRGALNGNQYSLRDGQSSYNNCIAAPSSNLNGTNLTDPVVEDPEKVLSTNPNDQSSPIGALCWARWEVARHLLLSTASDKSALEAAQDIATSAGATDEAWKGLPVEVQPFGDALLAATNTVKSEAFTDETAMDRLEAIFDFESFPAAKDYTNAAAQSTDCVRP